MLHTHGSGPLHLFSSAVLHWRITLDSSTLLSASAWLIYLCKSQMASGTISFWWPGRSDVSIPPCSLQWGSCAVIRVAPDKSRERFPLRGPGSCQSGTRRSLLGLLAVVSLQNTGLNSPPTPLLCWVSGRDCPTADGGMPPFPRSDPRSRWGPSGTHSWRQKLQGSKAFPSHPSSSSPRILLTFPHQNTKHYYS